MRVNLADRLRSIADALPTSGSVTFTRADLLELMAEIDVDSAPGSRRTAEGPAVDLTVAGVAELFGRGHGTVRRWVAEGRFPNAYRLHGREWRVPAGDVETMQRAEAVRFVLSTEPEASDSGPPDLGAWRRHVAVGGRA